MFLNKKWTFVIYMLTVLCGTAAILSFCVQQVASEIRMMSDSESETFTMYAPSETPRESISDETELPTPAAVDEAVAMSGVAPTASDESLPASGETSVVLGETEAASSGTSVVLGETEAASSEAGAMSGVAPTASNESLPASSEASGSSSDPAVQETTATITITAETAWVYDRDNFEDLWLARNAWFVENCHRILLVTLVFALAGLALLLIRSQRRTMPEGIELNLVLLFMVLRLPPWYGELETLRNDAWYAGITLWQGEVAKVMVYTSLFVWLMRSVASWVGSTFSLSYSLVWQATERRKDRENAISHLVFIPAAAALIFLILAVIAGYYGLLAAKADAGSLASINAYGSWVYEIPYGSWQWIVLHMLQGAAFGLFLCFLLAVWVLADRVRMLYRIQDDAIQQARTSERYRVDLVTNVSHDLRTPLTSIIGYGELLKNEELSEAGRDHLARLNKKAAYLRDMVDAVFDLSKVSSGVLKCRREKLDLIRLLEQTIGYYDEEIHAAGLQVKRHYAVETAPLVSDGIFLNQIFANLLTNAIKYTLPGTRIHLEVVLAEDGAPATRGQEKADARAKIDVPGAGRTAADRDTGCYVVRMINVASYEMKFDEHEILERFSRGDESRSSEGNGLGLAIVKAYSEAVGGTFEVKVDGDQFIAIVTLPASAFS